MQYKFSIQVHLYLGKKMSFSPQIVVVATAKLFAFLSPYLCICHHLNKRIHVVLPGQKSLFPQNYEQLTIILVLQNKIAKVFCDSKFIYFLFSLPVGFTVYVFYYKSVFVTIFLIR